MPRLNMRVVALVSAVILLGSAAELTRRLVVYYREHTPRRFAFQELDVREFIYADRSVRLVDEKDAFGVRYLHVSYGPEKLRLRVTIPHKQHDLLAAHGLAAHVDWMRLMRFAEYSGHDFDEVRGELKAGTRADRLALVTRTPRAGVDEETWGTVWRKDWTFDLHEFRPDGTFATQKLHYPTNRRGEIAKQGEIAEGTWEYDAALMTMPKGGVPAQHFVNTGFKAMGWTFPAVCLSSVVCVLGFVLSGPTRPVKPLPLP